MATVTGKTTEKIDELLNSTLVAGELNQAGQLTLKTKGGQSISAGSMSEVFVGMAYTLAGKLVATRRDGTLLEVASIPRVTPLDSWPIGSIYIGVQGTNPASLLGGGTWIPFGQGQFLVGVNPNDLDFVSPGTVGGVKSVTLTEAQLPSHSHTIDHTHNMSHRHEPYTSTDNFLVTTPGASPNRANGSGYHATGSGATGLPSPINTAGPSTSRSGATGSGAPITNLPPYIAAFMWRRTA